MKRTWLCTLFLLALLQQAAAQAPVAAFSSNRQSGCAPLGVAFRDESSNSPKYWSWDFGNGEFSNLQNPSITYAQPGTYTVTLTVRNGDGTNAITKTGYITVSTSPTASFSASATIACAPSVIRFTDLSVPQGGNPITEWLWDFGDGTTSTAQHPSKTYTDPGFYNVSLRVTSSTGCVAARSLGTPIRIVGGITPDFTFNTPTTCRPPFNINFSNQTSGPGTLTYRWDLGNGITSTQQDPVTNYTAAGTYPVTLTVTSQYGCTNSIQKNITINATGTDFTAPSAACLNAPVNFTNSSTPVSSTWYFGDGSSSEDINASHIYTAPGTYNVKLVNTYTECKDSVTKALVIEDKPVANFNATGTTSCKAPLTANFSNASPTATAWQWDFGDGGTSTDPNPSHTYTNYGDYDVTLTITNGNGCTNTITKTAFVRIVKPELNLVDIPTGDCAPFVYRPKFALTAIDGAAAYAWDFGNGVTSTAQSPAINYPNPGVYNVSLTITTRGGCTVSTSTTGAVKVGTPIPAKFTTTSLDTCAGSLVKFTNLTKPSDEWLWDFGDGHTSNQENPTHHFTDTGVFTVKLSSYNLKCSTTTSMNIHVQPPVAAFTYKVDCNQTGVVDFVNSSITNPAYGMISYEWDFGDPSLPNLNVANPGTVHYPGKGPYTVKLTVRNGTCSNTFTETFSFLSEPADFTVSPTIACALEPVTLTPVSSNHANIAEYTWVINGKEVPLGRNRLLITVFPPGTHTIGLKLTDNNGCVTTKVYPNVLTVGQTRALFKPVSRTACVNKQVIFTDQSTSTFTLQSWTFDFGDGHIQTFTAPPFTHIYSDTGKFVVKLRVTDNHNCSGSFISKDTIHVTGPVPGFKADFLTTCPGTTVTFTDTSTGVGLRYRWDFGDGTSSTVQNPTHIFRGADASTFNVKQVVTDLQGCTDSVTRHNYITLKKPKPAFDIADTTTICPPLETQFTFKGQDYESFYWDFGDGGASSLENPSHFYNKFGVYTAKLYLFGIGGCVDSASRIVRVIDPAATTNINFSPTTACDTLVVNFNITTPDYTSFTFAFGDGATDKSQSKILSHMYTAPNNYRPALTLRDSMGCQLVIGAKNTVQILGAEVIFGMDTKKFCDQGLVYFTDFTRPRQDPILSRTWDFGDGVTSTDPNPSHSYTQPGTYYPKLTAVTSGGCKSVMADTVRVYRTPAPVIISDPTACINEDLLLTAGLQVPDTAITWKWDPGGNGATTTVKYAQSGTYSVKLHASNLLGCSGDISKEINVPALPAINILQEPVIPVGGNITMPVSYTGDIVTWSWAPANTLSCGDCANPIASPKYTTKYIVQVTDSYGCTNSAGITVHVQCNDKNYFVPNTFSPNNDGHNDRFYPRGSNITRISSMKIFNRWGEMLFERRNFAANDPAAGWDGMAKGKPANPDVYIYVIEFICENAAIVPFRGNVTLLR